jgi:signal transduction histidine kinase
VEDRLFRALAVLRVVVLLNAVGLNAYRADNFARPLAGAVCVAAMVVWTAVALWGYADARRRTAVLLGLDLAVAVALMLLSPVVKGPAMQATVPGFWVMGALLAWALHWRWLGGLVAGLVLAVVDVAVRDEMSQSDYGNLFLILIGGPIVGFMAGSVMRMADERDAAERVAAAAEERARLARAVHDGVLQVLALVQRRGAELGGEAAGLGRLAGEQEAALRALIRGQDAVAAVGSGELDLTAELARLAAVRRVSLAGPDVPVLLPASTATGLVAAVAACLDNVARHVGDDAPAWVLLEELPDRVEVTVRDEGPGIPDGRLAAAEREGRLGVTGSIRGRLADLGGSAALATGSFGTEWELSVPRPPLAGRPAAVRSPG